MAATKEKRGTNRIASTNGKQKAATKSRVIEVPEMQQEEFVITLIGDSPLMVNNKLNVAAELDKTYSEPGGKTAAVKKAAPTKDEAYLRAFYVLPDSPYDPPHLKAHYGIPTSGIKKCIDAAIRTTGISDNATIGNISKAFRVFPVEGGGGLTRIKFEKLERDVRMVNIGSGQKTMPQLRHRPMFHGWTCAVRVRYNPMILGPEQIVNLFQHAGAYIGYGEMRAQKKMGECGGFTVEASKV